MSESEAEDPPYIATEILELVIDELGAEAEPLPTTSAAFQTLLNFSLTGHHVLTRCQRNLFSVLNFDSPERKGRKIPVWVHLRRTIEMFEEKPQFASYVRCLKISFFRAFSSAAMLPRPVSSRDFESIREAEATMLPHLLQQLSNITSFSLDGLGFQHGARYSWRSLTPSFQLSITTFLARPRVGGNVLEELSLSNFVMVPPDVLKGLPHSLRTIRLVSTSFDWPPNGSQAALLQPRQWKFALTSLDFSSRYEVIDTLLAHDSGKHLANLKNLRCWVQRTGHTESLGRLLSVCSAGLRSLEVSSYGRRGHLSSLISNINIPKFRRLQFLSLSCEIDGYIVQRTDPDCPDEIARLLKHIVGKAPVLRTIHLHAVWSFLGTVDPSKRFLFMGGREWYDLDDWLSHHTFRQRYLDTICVRATPHALCTGSRLDQDRARTYPRLSKGTLERANREMLAMFENTKERMRVELWSEPDERFRSQGGEICEIIVPDPNLSHWFPLTVD